MIRSHFASSALAGVALLIAPALAAAQQSSPTFAGKTIALNVGYGAGSGNDILGRLIAAHLGKHVPGNPTVLMQNMPGAGSFKAANYLYNVAPKDGTVLGYIAQTAATEELLGNPGVRFKTGKFNWIGRISSYNIVTTTWQTSKVKTIADAQKFEASMGATGAGSTVYIYPNVMNKVLGTKFKIVSGYEGTNQTALAMERGEVDGATMGWFTIKSTKKEWLKGNKINVLVQFMRERDADLPNVPTIIELGRTPNERQLFGLLANEGEIGKGIFGPPGMKPETVAVLRKAFSAMMIDPDFIAEANRLQVDLSPLSGEKLQAVIESVAKTPPEIIAYAKSMLK